MNSKFSLDSLRFSQSCSLIVPSALFSSLEENVFILKNITKFKNKKNLIIIRRFWFGSFIVAFVWYKDCWFGWGHQDIFLIGCFIALIKWWWMGKRWRLVDVFDWAMKRRLDHIGAEENFGPLISAFFHR